MTVKEMFEKHRDDYLGGGRDLRAFNLLASLVPGTDDIVSCAEHDEIWLSITPEDLEGKITEEQVIELLQCGVRYDSSIDGLALFV